MLLRTSDACFGYMHARAIHRMPDKEKRNIQPLEAREANKIKAYSTSEMKQLYSISKHLIESNEGAVLKGLSLATYNIYNPFTTLQK